MKLCFSSPDQLQADFNFDTEQYQSLLITLPDKQIEIDMLSGSVVDEPLTPQASIATADLVAEFELYQRKSGLSEGTIASNLSVLNSLVRLVPDWPPDIEDIDALLDDYQIRGYSKVTLAAYWSRLNTWFNWTQTMRYLTYNPMNRVARRKMPKVKAGVIQPGDFVKFITALHEVISTTLLRQRCLPHERAIRDLAIVRFAYATGCRAGEIVKLRLRDLNVSKRSALIVAEHSKTKEERTVYFGKQSLLALQEWLDIRPKTGTKVFVGTCGNGWSSRALTSAGVYRAWRNWQQKVGIGPYKFHEIRHSHVTHSLNQGIPLHHVSKQAGHASPDITLRIYTHSEDPERQQAYDYQNPDDNLGV